MKSTIDRREFLTRAGLTLAIAATPSGLKVFAMGQAGTDSDLFRPTVWFHIAPDNQVTVFVSKSEMGQGVHTALPMIVADELEADWSQVQIEVAPVREEYNDPVMRAQATYGSTTIRHLYDLMRKAGAAGREMLQQAAAQKWNVPAGECETSRSQVHHKPSGRTLSYGELCEAAAGIPFPENPRLKQKSEFRIMGTPVPRVDIPAKVSGKARFGIDTFVPGMLYGVVARPPVYGARVTSYDEQAAQKIEGVRHLVKINRGIGVCADTLEAAWKGRKALESKWGGGTKPELSTETEDKLLADSLNRTGVSARNDGDVQGALKQAYKRVRAEYLLPYLYHAVMEPMDCTAHVQVHRCDVWVPTQSQSGVLEKTVQITGLKPEQINIYTPYLGGGFGRRGGVGVVEEAVELSRATGTPVKVIWTREEDLKYDPYRPGTSCRIEGALDKEGRVTAWSHRLASASVMAAIRGGRGGGPPVDPFALGGLRNLQYQIPNVSVDYIRVKTPVPVRPWRSPAGSHNGFTVESFMDELAHAAHQDPVEFRLKHLEHAPRAQRVVKVAAEKAGWGQPLADGRARGIATFLSDDTYVAEVAEISLDRKTGVLRVHQVVCAVDCGPVINPDTVVAQMEGAVTMGLSAALKEKVEFANGGVQSTNFLDYPLLRMSEAPDIEVHIVESDGKIGGVGEPGLPPIAPAVANALFAATGTRIRHLPMTPETVLEALRKSESSLG